MVLFHLAENSYRSFPCMLFVIEIKLNYKNIIQFSYTSLTA